jgi:hypothetical protein
MNDQYLTALGEHLKDGAEEKALHHLELMRFMTRNASAEIWGKADQAGLKPGAGPWLIFMNQHRTKLAGTKAEADEIVRLVQVRYGDDSESILEWLRHAVFDPLWALRNLRVMAGETGLTATTSDGVGEI